MSTIKSVETYLTQLQQTVANLSPNLIDQVVTLLLERVRWGSTVYIFGNGGSAATASHFACDLAKNTMVPNAPRFRAIALTDNISLISAWANDTAYENIFAAQLKPLVAAGDVVIGISCSGNSPNVLKAMAVAREHGAVTVAFTGDQGGSLKGMVDLCIQVPSPSIEQQEDVHLILEHCICATIREELTREHNLLPSSLDLISSREAIPG